MMKLKPSAAVTFRVHDVDTVRTPLEKCKTRDSISKILGSVEQEEKPSIFACSGYNSEVVAATKYHALIGAVHIAFAEHRPIILSPDAIWITILQGLAMHVHVHSSELRPLLVSHAGRKKLEIEVNIDSDSPESAWEEVVGRFAESLASEAQDANSLLNDFSTTGPIDRLVSQVCVLDVFESYFEYVLTCKCGFPEISLSGSQSDWLHLRQKIELLEKFKIDFWLPHLRIIADQFCRASRGDVDLQHWQDMYKQVECYGVDRVNGWLVKLIPYLRNSLTGNWDTVNPLLTDDSYGKDNYRGPATDELPAGMAVVPFRCIDKLKNYRAMELIGGFVGIEQSPKTFALQPKIGWAIRQLQDRAWQSLQSSKNLAKKSAVSNNRLTAALLKLEKEARFSIGIPGEFIQFYKQCDGLIARDKAGLKWSVLPISKVKQLMVEVEDDGTFDGIHFDPEVAREDGSIFLSNQRFLQICQCSDGSTVLINTNKRRDGIHDVVLVDSANKRTATFLGLRRFVDYLEEIAT